jgi:hypothetical protein
LRTILATSILEVVSRPPGAQEFKAPSTKEIEEAVQHFDKDRKRNAITKCWGGAVLYPVPI